MKTSTSIALGAGAAFVAYCLYFDYTRRRDPQYKEKVMARMFTEFYMNVYTQRPRGTA